MTTGELVVKSLNKVDYTEAKKAVDGCDSSFDFVITSEVKAGTFHCPVVDRDVELSESGYCKETRSTCKEHY